MKVGLNYAGPGGKAVIYTEDDEIIILNAHKHTDGVFMTIKNGRDVIALGKSDIIALRDYLNQITHTF